jgi:hypothetical protein
MTIVASGQVSIQDLVDEFGGTAPHNLTEYYRGGAFVDDITNNNSVPLSGEIQLKDFYGAANSVTVTVTQAEVTQFTTVEGYVATNKIPKIARDGFETNPSGGSRSPTTLNGATIQLVGVTSQKGTNWLFMVVLSGTRAKSFFTSVTPSGAQGTYNTSTVSNLYTFGSSTIWEWSKSPTGADATWDGSGVVTADFV